jgi:anthranilate phosphoribosyltransferase
MGGLSLSIEEAQETIKLLASENTRDIERLVFLAIFDPNIVTAEELAGFALGVIEMSTPVSIKMPPNTTIIDVCGTGGGGRKN